MPAPMMHLAFGQGVDEDAEPQLSPSPVFTTVQNLRVDKAGRLVARAGATAISDTTTDNDTLGQVRWLGEHRGELLRISDDPDLGIPCLWGWSESVAKWVRRGPVPSHTYPERVLLEGGPEPVALPQCAVVGDYLVTAWWKQTTSTEALKASGEIWLTVTDTATGNVVYRVDAAGVTDAGFPRLVTDGTYVFLLWLRDVGVAGPYSVYARRFIPSTLSWAAAAVQVVADLVREDGNYYGHYDAAAYGGELFIAWDSSAANQVSLARYNLALSQQATDDQATGAGNDGVALHVDANYVWVAYGNSSDGTEFYLANTSTMTTSSGPTNLHATTSTCLGMSRCPDDTTRALLVGNRSGAATCWTLTATPSGAEAEPLYHCGVVSRPAVMSVGVGDYEAAFLLVGTFLANAPDSGGESYRSLYLVRVQPANPSVILADSAGWWPDVAIAPGRAGVTYSIGQGIGACSLGVTTGGDIYMPTAEALEADEGGHYVARRVARGVGLGDFYVSVKVPGQLPATAAAVYHVSATDIPYTGATVGNLLAIGGCGLACWYDGVQVFEANFCQAPSLAASDVVGLSTVFAIGEKYGYVGQYEWRDAQGNTHRSALSPPVVRTVAANAEWLRVATSCTGLTLRQRHANETAPRGRGVAIVLYRTQESGTVFTRVTTEGALAPANDMDAASVNFDDGAADADIQDNRAAEIHARVVSATFAIPSRAVTQAGNRAWHADGAGAWFSSAWIPGEGPRFADDWFIPVPDDVLAVGELDESAVCFSSRGAWVIAGDGPTETGDGAFAPARSLPACSGCERPRSVVTYRDGLMYESPQGVEVLPRGFGPAVWLGAQVRETIGPSLHVVAAAVSPATRQVALAVTHDEGPDSSLNRVVLWDWHRQAWTTEKIGTGADPVKGLAYYDGALALGHYSATRVRLRDATWPTEPMVLETSWLRPGGILAEAQFMSLRLLAEWRGLCSLTVEFAYDGGDYGADPGDTHVIDYAAPGDWTAGDIIRQRITLRRQKCDALRIRLTVDGDAATEGLALHGMTLELAEQPTQARHLSGMQSR